MINEYLRTHPLVHHHRVKMTDEALAAVQKYAEQHRGKINLATAAKKLRLTPDEIDSAIHKLKALGKLK